MEEMTNDCEIHGFNSVIGHLVIRPHLIWTFIHRALLTYPFARNFAVDAFH